MRIGVLSDTHGLLRPEVLPALAGCEHIFHAGDVGDPAILDALRTIAPVTAIRGNTDTHGPCAQLPETEFIPLAGRHFYLIHALAYIRLSPAAAGICCVISGHTHSPETHSRSGVLYLNPGSCGPRRFSLPVTLSILEVTEDALTPQLIHLI